MYPITSYKITPNLFGVTAADLFMSTAEALGLTPRQRREGLEELQRAAERIERAESEGSE